MVIHLPEEMVEKILSILPIKSLLRFRCVSKSWLALMSTIDFAHLQLQRASKMGISKIILWNDEHGLRSVDCETSSSSFDDLSTSRSLKFPFDGSSLIIGSSNGLLCVSAMFPNKIYIWNPSTNEYKTIPDLPNGKFRGANRFGFNRFGFGYDDFTDDYKVIIFSYFMINIFSLQRGTWISFKDTLNHNAISIYTSVKRGVYLKGALHWPFDELASKRLPLLLSFRLADESFSYIAGPNSGGQYIADYCGLGVLYGSLCWTIRKSRTIWIMKQYGVSSSWEKLTTIHFGKRSQIINECSPIYATGQGQILLRNRGGYDVACFNIKTKYPGKLHISYHDATAYMESLISPNATQSERKNDATVYLESLFSANATQNKRRRLC